MQIYVDGNAVRSGNGQKEYPFRTISEAAKIARPGDEVLVSRMRDGSQVTFSGTKVLPLVQERIDQAEREGARAIIVQELCTVLWNRGKL